MKFKLDIYTHNNDTARDCAMFISVEVILRGTVTYFPADAFAASLSIADLYVRSLFGDSILSFLLCTIGMNCDVAFAQGEKESDLQHDSSRSTCTSCWPSQIASTSTPYL